VQNLIFIAFIYLAFGDFSIQTNIMMESRKAQTILELIEKDIGIIMFSKLSLNVAA
jgi:hypothetical protein